jgi:CHAT domain-containing protein
MNPRVSIIALNLMMLNSAPVIGQDLARSPLSQSVAVQEIPRSLLSQRAAGRSLALQDELTTATQLLQQGMTAYQANQFNAAIASWQQALTLFRQIKNRQGEEFTLGLLITGYLAIGDYNHILVSAEQWLKIASDDSNRAKAMGYLGIAYKNLGDYAQAIEIQQQALTIFQKLQDSQSTGQLLNNLGNTYAVIGDYDRANPIYQQSLKVAELPQINDLPLQIGILINLGTTYHLLGQYSLGMTNYQKGLALAQQINNPQLQGNVLSNLGLIYEDRNNYSQSIQAHKQSIAIAKASNNPQAEALARNNLAHVLLAAKSLGEAEEQLNSAIKLLDRVRSQLSDLEQVNIFDTQVSTYNLLQQVLIANNKPETALEALEKGRARAFAQLLSNRFNTSSKIQTARAKSLETLSIEQIRQIAKQQNATLVSYGIIPDEAFKFRGKQRGREAELFIWVVQPTGKVTFRRVNLQPLWKRDITLQELVSISLCLETAPTCSTIEDFVRERNRRRKPLVKLADKENLSSGKYPGLKELYQLLVAPISDLLPKNPEEEVIFIPQDSLLLVPFAALQTPDNKFLIQKHTIRVAPSIQVLSLTYQQRQRQRQSPNQLEIVVVGNPTMPSVRPIPGEARRKLAQLPNAEKEAIAIAKSFNTQAIVGDAATKANVLPKLKQARLIHLATHGLLEYSSRIGGVQKEIPGAIALAPAGKDDGLLTASEIFDLNLNAQLVVLSACDTGQGRVTGDGVVGLSRAWIAAGVPSAIVSLREVPDKQTSVLMTSFYQYWKKTPNVARALRRGTLETMKKYPDPIAWGAFISIGESE